MRTHPAGPPLMLLAGLLAALMLGLAIAGCGPSQPSESPMARVSPAPSGTTPTARPTATPEADQTDTDWGRIWDDLPKGFPVYTGAARSDETDLGPASAIYVVQGASATDVIGWYDTRLQAAGYRVDALDGPTEDGGFTLDTTGRSTDCRLEVRVVPMSTASAFLAIPIMYGAGCPKP